jgi:hypothetical protein
VSGVSDGPELLHQLDAAQLRLFRLTVRHLLSNLTMCIHTN